jgi:hypothetical protein
LVVRHESVDDWPISIAAGEAVKEIVGAGGVVGVTAGGGGGAAAGGGAATFLEHPVPVTAMPARRRTITAMDTEIFS